jgi:AraC family transcriptional regulator
MEWSERMNAAIAYIEDNLAGEIDYDEAAKLACCSLFHFQRMFFAIIGVTPAEYARRRRLTLAARELTTNGDKVIDIALKYGYDSPDSFARAFRNVHGINPQAARASGAKLTTFPRISFHIELKGGNDMDYKIIEKPAFEVIGKLKRASSTIIKKSIIDPEVWNRYDIWDEFSRTRHNESLEKLTQGKPGPVTGANCLGICVADEKMEKYTYTIGVEKPDTGAPAGFDVIRIPASTWAVFEAIGPFPQTIHDLEDKIFIEWFPSTGYEHAGTPELEVYLPGDRESEDYHCQYWLPIIKKK